MGKLELTPFQKRVLAASEDVDVCVNMGGRGGGKSFLNMMAALRHADRYGPHARIMFVRRQLAAMTELQDDLENILITAYGESAVTRNRNQGEFRLANGAIFRCESVEYMTPSTLARLQGGSISFLVVEEAAQFESERVVDQLFSNLRAPDHVKVQCFMSLNPGGVGAAWIKRRTIEQANAMEPYTERESGLRYLFSLSTFRDNTKLADGYEGRLRASVASDPALGAAWVDGSFDRVSGSMFGDVFDPNVHVIEPWLSIPRGFDIRLGLDHGGVSPSVATLMLVAREPAIGFDDRLYPAGSAIIIGEVSTAIPPSLTEGDGSSPSDIAARIKEELFAPYGLRPAHLKVMAADPQINQRGSGKRSYSVSDEYRDAGLRFISANRANRPARVQQFRSLLDGAVKNDGRPGLYICSNAENLIQVLPILQRSVHRPNDLETRSNKHSFDSASYALSTTSRGSTTRQYGSGDSKRRYSRREREQDERGIKV